MPIEGEYEPSTWGWVADQVERYEASGGTEANTLMDTTAKMPAVPTLRKTKERKKWLVDRCSTGRAAMQLLIKWSRNRREHTVLLCAACK